MTVFNSARTRGRHGRGTVAQLVGAGVLAGSLLATSACGSNDQAGAQTTGKNHPAAYDALPESVQKAGVLKVASAFDYAPHSYIEGGKQVGVDIDIINAIGKDLGVKIEWVRLPAFNTLIPGVQAGRADAAVEYFGVIEDRLKALQFVTYMAADQAIIVKKGNPAGIDTTHLCGTHLSSDSGSVNYLTLKQISDKCVADGEKAIEVELFPTPAAQQLAVESGRVDGYTGGAASGAYLAKQTGTLEVAGEVPEGRGLAGIVIGRDADGDAVAKAMQIATQQIIDDGTMKTVLDKWGVGNSVLPKSMVVNNKSDLDTALAEVTKG